MILETGGLTTSDWPVIKVNGLTGPVTVDGNLAEDPTGNFTGGFVKEVRAR